MHEERVQQKYVKFDSPIIHTKCVEFSYLSAENLTNSVNKRLDNECFNLNIQ